MASLPRWPLPSASTKDGPTGSSTTASSANRPIHPSRSLASDIAIDFFDISNAAPMASSSPLCAVCRRTLSAVEPCVPSNPVCRRNRNSGLHLGDDVVGEPPQAIDLGLQGLDVGAHHI